PAQPFLLFAAAIARQALRVRYRATVGNAGRQGAAPDPQWFGQREDRLPLPGRARAREREGASVRRRRAEPRAPLPRDRFARGARGARQADQTAGLPRLRRRTLAARSAPCAA